MITITKLTQIANRMIDEARANIVKRGEELVANPESTLRWSTTEFVDGVQLKVGSRVLAYLTPDTGYSPEARVQAIYDEALRTVVMMGRTPERGRRRSSLTFSSARSSRPGPTWPTR